MKHGITNKFTTGHFTLRDSFDIPQGTPVVYGERDCDGNHFPHWTLPESVARGYAPQLATVLLRERNPDS